MHLLLLVKARARASDNRGVEEECCLVLLTQRPIWVLAAYTAEDVISLRGSIQQTYPGDAMSQKIWDTFQVCRETGAHSRTFGALDPVQVTTMAPVLSSIYVSGWQSSSTAAT